MGIGFMLEILFFIILLLTQALLNKNPYFRISISSNILLHLNFNQMKNKALLIITLTSISFLTQAQNIDKKAILEAINRDIWKPFSEAYGTSQPEKYIALHSKDFIRAEGNEKQIKDLAGYADGVRQMFSNVVKDKTKVDINFRFLERVTNEQSASERGIYEFIYITAKGEKQVFYGKFHVFLRKEKGIWKILIDYDSNENNTINAQSFQAAFGMEEFEKY